jgi:RNA polymerase subunit RPABC4/transcription elongation factor Spt4
MLLGVEKCCVDYTNIIQSSSNACAIAHFSPKSVKLGCSISMLLGVEKCCVDCTNIIQSSSNACAIAHFSRIGKAWL